MKSPNKDDYSIALTHSLVDLIARLLAAERLDRYCLDAVVGQIVAVAVGHVAIRIGVHSNGVRGVALVATSVAREKVEQRLGRFLLLGLVTFALDVVEVDVADRLVFGRGADGVFAFWVVVVVVVIVVVVQLKVRVVEAAGECLARVHVGLGGDGDELVVGQVGDLVVDEAEVERRHVDTGALRAGQAEP